MLITGALALHKEIFKVSGKTPKTAVLMSVNDTFGTAMVNGIKALFPKLDMPYEIVDMITYDPARQGPLGRGRQGQGDQGRAADAGDAAERRQAAGPGDGQAALGADGHHEPGRARPVRAGLLKTMGKYRDFCISNVPWLDPKSAMTQALEKRFTRKFPNDQLELNVGFTFEAILIAADAYKRAKSTKADALIEALRKTKIDQHVMVGGPIQFDAKGQNVNIKSAAVAEPQAQADVVLPARRGGGKAGLPDAGLERQAAADAQAARAVARPAPCLAAAS